jgi:hypothetical protein
LESSSLEKNLAALPEWGASRLVQLVRDQRLAIDCLYPRDNLSQKHRVQPQTEPDGNRQRADQVAYQPHGLTFVWQLLCMGHDRNLATDVQRSLPLLIRRSCEGPGLSGPRLHIVSRYNALDFASARLEKLPNRLGITIRADCDEHGTPQYYPRVEASCLVNRVNTVSGFIRIAVFISSSTSC